MLCTSVLGNWRYLEEYSITRVECGKNFPWYCESHGTLLWLWTMLCQSNLFVSICRVLTLTSVSKQWMSEPQSLPLVIVGIIPFATKKSFSAWGKNKFRNTCSWVNHTCTKTKWPPTINMGFRTQGGGGLLMVCLLFQDVGFNILKHQQMIAMLVHCIQDCHCQKMLVELAPCWWKASTGFSLQHVWACY